ncbi:putative leucine-rich repeat-containing protein DDB_G0290503 [Battus philenor]|uniref:putative leucine-rich repeat-containing protein DDB_G0290503 n=1 Tax=Battus philenor TaxID=42288 RepID=UPI0035D07785
MFSKAKRFEPILRLGTNKSELSNGTKEKTKSAPIPKSRQKPLDTPSKVNSDVLSQCSSTSSAKSFITPQPVKSYTAAKTKSSNSLKKMTVNHNKNVQTKTSHKPACQIPDLIKAQEVEIRNKDQTISEYNKQIEDLKTELAKLQMKLSDKTINTNYDVQYLDDKFQQITLCDKDNAANNKIYIQKSNESNTIDKLNQDIIKLENLCSKLEKEVSSKQVELTALEEVIVIRDSLCQDLQNKLTDMNTCLEETKQRLEMVKGHHALALEANESIRREYKAELETLKNKMEEEKQVIISKSKTEQESIKSHYKSLITKISEELVNEKNVVIAELNDKLAIKDQEMKAKLEQIEEATCEKLKLSEIQFEERSRSIQEHWSLQENQIQCLESEMKELRYKLSLSEDHNKKIHNQLICLEKENESLKSEKTRLADQLNELKEESKKTVIEYENKINKLTVEVEKTIKEKNKFEMSLSVTRDIVQVLTMRLRESDAELEHLEAKIQSLTNSKESTESELLKYKNTLDNTVLECNEYKEALVNILKSKAALAKEHTRIMEHNVTLIESLQNVEKEAYRELGTIKTELIEDVELLKKESNSQIQMLREEVEKKRMLCELATEHAGQATAAAEQSRALLSHAANEISRLEAENSCLQKQIQDQQSLVVELSLLRQENEELSMMMAKQSSIMDKMKKEMEQLQVTPKSPSVGRKTIKIGKENIQTVVSPLRERNH